MNAKTHVWILALVLVIKLVKADAAQHAKEGVIHLAVPLVLEDVNNIVLFNVQVPVQKVRGKQ